ncbi:ribonucleotide reductase subunit alpha [Reinekea sp.]|jgi:hypothetical protein|uniref:ribonucleotide reductase subunit alpha n=1 Tax=Reinekea sp. TaxID=1970455 RepID=UPI003989FC2B
MGEIKINITDYESLLKAAHLQAEPQRLLFVFLTVSLPDDYKDEEKANFQAGQGGTLDPVMCVDKSLKELGDFSDLVKESEQLEQQWQIVLVASLSGHNGVEPDSEAAEPFLTKMVENVQQGGDLSSYMAFTRDGETVRFN